MDQLKTFANGVDQEEDAQNEHTSSKTFANAACQDEGAQNELSNFKPLKMVLVKRRMFKMN